MLNYVIRRLAGILIMLLLLSLVTFVLSRTVPGGPFGKSEVPMGEQQMAMFKAKYGLDKPIMTQYITWLGQAITLIIPGNERCLAHLSFVVNVRYEHGRASGPSLCPYQHHPAACSAASPSTAKCRASHTWSPY